MQGRQQERFIFEGFTILILVWSCGAIGIPELQVSASGISVISLAHFLENNVPLRTRRRSFQFLNEWRDQCGERF